MKTRAGGAKPSESRFETISPPRVERSAFDLSHTHKTTMDSGFLYPLMVEEMLPGDTISVEPTFFVRFASPLEKPYMDGLRLDWQAFFIPNRQVWDNFVRMMGERDNPDDHNDYTVPQIVAPVGGWAVGTSLADYFGIPTGIAGISTTSLYHRAYNLCYQEWYRDANLQDAIPVPKDDGPDDPADFVLRRRGKRKDYVTGALPFAQRGEAVQLPLGDQAPIEGLTPLVGSGAPSFDVNGNIGFLNKAVGTANGNIEFLAISGNNTNTGPLAWEQNGLTADFGAIASSAYADLSAATASTINEMRNAIALQHAFERDARGGGRYRETVMATFGVQTDDIRLMRPQVIGVGSMPISPQVVPQTSETGSTPLAELAAFGVGAGGSRRVTYSATEHGMIMLIASVRADLTYQNYLDRRFTRETRFDFYHPDLAKIGEQPVLSREVWVDGTGDEAQGTGDYAVWGYQPRWEEMRMRRSLVTGEFRSDFAQSLDVWHLALDFATRPALNSAFIEENPPVDRVIVLQDEPQFLVDCSFQQRMIRPMPRRSTPGLSRF